MSISEETINIACFQTRLKYDQLNQSLNTIEDRSPNDKYIIVYDIAYPISVIKRISSVENDSDLSNETLIRIAYGLINSAAHYRHFLSTKLYSSSVIIMYSSDETVYEDFSKVISIIRRVLNLFKKTIVIEKLDENIKNTYQHVCYFTCMNIVVTNNAAKKKCRIIYIGNNDLFLQMLRIDRDMFHIKYEYINTGINLFNEYLGIDNSLDVHFNSDIVTICLAIFGYKSGYPKLESIKRKKVLNIYKQLIFNCKDLNSIDKDECKYLFNNIEISNNDYNLFNLRLKSLDVDFQNKLFVLSKSLLKIWSSKLQTNKTQSINDFIVSDIELSFSWLDFN